MKDNDNKRQIRYTTGNIHEVYELYNSNLKYIQPENEKFICRYCGETEKKNFKSKAHLIPEFTGSKDLFSFNECKNCNHKFGVNYENSLRNFAVKNLYVPIKGKGGFKKHIDFENDSVTQFEDEKTLVTTLNSKEFKNEIVNGKMKFETTSYPFVPLYVYKSLMKIALSLLKTEDLKFLKHGFDWINNVEMQTKTKIPLTLIVNDEAKPALLKPIALLLRKKIEYNSPEFTFIFSWGFYNLQIFLPFNSNDLNLDYSIFNLPIRPDFIRQSKDGKIRFQHFNMVSIDKFKVKQDLLVPFEPSKEYIERKGKL